MESIIFFASESKLRKSREKAGEYRQVRGRLFFSNLFFFFPHICCAKTPSNNEQQKHGHDYG